MTPNPASKPVIAVDIDDVLAGLAESFVDFTNQRWGTRLTIDDYDEHWSVVWRVDDEETYKRADEFFNEFPKFKRISDAPEALEKLKTDYGFVIITSRRRKLDKHTRQWLNEHYPNIFSEIHYSGIWDDIRIHSSEKINLTKGEICRQIGADYLIDDQLKHCLAAAEAGIPSLLFGDYSWNQAQKLPAGVTRVKNWQEVLEYFDGR